MNFEKYPHIIPRPADTSRDASDVVQKCVHELQAEGLNMNPFVVGYFMDPRLFRALSGEMKNDGQKLKEYILNTSRFADIIETERRKRWGGALTGLFGEELKAGETRHADGRLRREESGYRVNTDYLTNLGIDSEKVIFFRVTQPAQEPKPELYWTSDFFETMHGLRQEISLENRKTSVILGCALGVLDRVGGGIITDINDDEGLSVRLVALGVFDQANALFIIQPQE